jgi:hypothetical protein
VALTGELFMRDDPQVLSRRLATFVRHRPAKELADTIGCDVRTAENIRRGHWPIARHWAGLVRAFGRDVTEAVFHPDAAARRLAEEVADLEAQLAKRRADLLVVETSVRSPSPRMAQGEREGRPRP